MQTTNKSGLKWTATAAAKEFGASRETVIRGLRGLGLNVQKGSTFTTREIFRALAGDLKYERTREVRARANLLELQTKEREKVLISLEEAKQILTEALGPVRQRFLVLPVECASRCNPQDPQFARQALETWRDDAMRLVREELEK